MKPEATCHEMTEEFREVAGWWAGGGLAPEQYRALVAEFEARKMARHGLRLSSATSADGLVHFTLRQADTGELCARVEVDPRTGKAEVQHPTW